MTKRWEIGADPLSAKARHVWQLENLARQAAQGRISRRDFVGRAGALGVSSAFAGPMLATAARAAGPVKGGVLRAGGQGGQIDQQPGSGACHIGMCPSWSTPPGMRRWWMWN